MGTSHKNDQCRPKASCMLRDNWNVILASGERNDQEMTVNICVSRDSFSFFRSFLFEFKKEKRFRLYSMNWNKKHDSFIIHSWSEVIKSILCEFWGCFLWGQQFRRSGVKKSLVSQTERTFRRINKTQQLRNFNTFETNILFGELVCKFTMATCSFSSLFRLTSLCGASSKNPQDLQCVRLRDCNKDVHPHLKSLQIGPVEEKVKVLHWNMTTFCKESMGLLVFEKT